MRASHRALEAVYALNSFKNLVEHCGSVLVALGKAQLSTVHTLKDIYTVSLSECCVPCGRFGAFICLITWERACLPLSPPQHEILGTRYPRCADSLRHTAGRALPIDGHVVHSAPSSSELPTGRLVRRQKLVGVRQACELGLELHGSPSEMKSWVQQGGRARKWMSEYELVRHRG
jgi:hypothetical protein